MTTLPQARSSKVQYDGAGIIHVSSGLIDLTTADTGSGHFVVPFDGTIEEFYYNLLEAPGTAAATLAIGKFGDLDAFLDDVSIPTTQATGLVRIAGDTDLAAVASVTVSAGDVIIFGTDGGATSTGKAVAGFVLTPRQT